MAFSERSRRESVPGELRHGTPRFPDRHRSSSPLAGAGSGPEHAAAAEPGRRQHAGTAHRQPPRGPSTASRGAASTSPSGRPTCISAPSRANTRPCTEGSTSCWKRVGRIVLATPTPTPAATNVSTAHHMRAWSARRGRCPRWCATSATSAAGRTRAAAGTDDEAHQQPGGDGWPRAARSRCRRARTVRRRARR